MSGADSDPWCSGAICIIFSLGDIRCIMFTSLENDANRSRQSKVEEICEEIIGNLEGLGSWKTSNHLRTGEN